MKKVPLTKVETLVAGIFNSLGYSQEASQAIAAIVADADLRGVHSHGVMRIPIYVERIRSGLVSRHEAGKVIVDRDAVAVIDALNAMGQLIALQAMELAVSRAHKYGVGAVGVINSNHFGAAGWYAALAARRSCIGIAVSNTTPLMPAPGGAQAVVGNNPMAIAVPTREGPPWVLDMALSQVALGKVKLAMESGEEIPDSWGFTPDGLPSTDPSEVLRGFLRPIGGHKGFGLAWMIDVLCGPLLGGAWGPHVRSIYKDFENPNHCGHFFLALRVEHFGVLSAYNDDLGQMVDHVHRSRKAPGTGWIYVPGEIELEKATRNAKEGVPVDPGVLAQLEKLATELGVEGAPRRLIP